MNALVLVLAFLFLPSIGWGQQQIVTKKDYQNPQEYLEALKTSLELYKQKKITPLEFENVFFAVGSMRFFLSYNYEDPEVAALLQSIQNARISESIASNVPDYISGKQRQRDIAIRKAHPELAKPVPLRSGGFAPPDPEPSIVPDPMSAVLLPPAISPAPDLQEPGASVSLMRRGQIEPSTTWRLPVWVIVTLFAAVVAGAVFFLGKRLR